MIRAFRMAGTSFENDLDYASSEDLPLQYGLPVEIR